MGKHPSLPCTGDLSVSPPDSDPYLPLFNGYQPPACSNPHTTTTRPQYNFLLLGASGKSHMLYTDDPSEASVGHISAKAENIPFGSFVLLESGKPFIRPIYSVRSDVIVIRMMITGNGGSAPKRARNNDVNEDENKRQDILQHFHPETLRSLIAINNANTRHSSKVKDFDSPGIFLGCIDEGDFGNKHLKRSPNGAVTLGFKEAFPFTVTSPLELGSSIQPSSRSVCPFRYSSMLCWHTRTARKTVNQSKLRFV